MTTAMEAYGGAQKRFEAIARHAKIIVERVQTGAAQLENWRMLMAVNCDPYKFPEEIALRQNPGSGFDANLWPTGQEIAQALSEYHSTWEIVLLRYQSLNESEKQSVPPPPQYPPA